MDEIDIKILKHLQEDAKITTKDLASRLSLSVTPVYERIRKLEKSGIIKKYVAVLNADLLNKSLIVFLNLTIKEHHLAARKALLQELVLQPRLKALEWSKVTKQTPNIKIGYPGQHLASLITGIEGSRTGARGDDLRDGTEVKSCSRVDQLDTCSNCDSSIKDKRFHKLKM